MAARWKSWVPILKVADANASELFIAVDDIDAIHADLVSRGAEPQGLPEDRWCGVRDFGIVDPDGHHLTLGAALATFDKSPDRNNAE